jgi:beta-glucosidase
MTPSRRQFLATSFAAAAAAAVPASNMYSKHDAQARKILAQMTLDEKIGQMTQPDQMNLKSLDEIETYALGSLLSGGDSDPKTGNDLTSWTDMYDRYQARALKTRLRIPLLYGVDAVHGHNNVIGATVFPHNIGLGCTRNAKLVEEASRITAIETRATGIHWAFAPCVTVPQDIRWGRTYEGYSESPDIVKPLGEASVRGLQGKSLDAPLSVLSCAKHFAGDGGTVFGTGMPKSKDGKERFPLDRGDVRMDEAAFRALHLAGYPLAIAAGTGTIMPSYSSWNGEKCSGNRHLLTDILKKDFGFEGFLISDYNALDELPGDYKQQIAQSINAGMDMVMVPDKYVLFMKLLKELAADGTVPMSRIDDAVVRILRVKIAMGLMNPKTSLLADRKLHARFGSTEHRAVARQCVRESVVVLKNDKGTLPLKKSSRVHVAGKAHNDIGYQCGGWTITWQGKPGPVTEGTTMLAAVRKAVGNGQVTSSMDGSGAEGAAVGIAVIGEPPYAEMMGDRTDLRISREDVAVVENLKRAGIPVVAVIYSGRPLVIDDIIGKADAIVAAWLPGTEGDGIADILFGVHKPTGKLSYTWPSGETVTFQRRDTTYKALYPLGHGLLY